MRGNYFVFLSGVLPAVAFAQFTGTVRVNNLPVWDGGLPVRIVGGATGLTDTELRATPIAVSGTVTANVGTGTQPVSGTLTCNAGTGTLAVSGPVTDSQLRATAVPVNGTVTANVGTGTQPVSGTFWQTTQPVSLASAPTTPVTGTFWQGTQPVSGTLTCNAGSGTQAVSGPLTDTQLRASVVPVSLSSTTVTGSVAVTGPLTDTQLRATAVPVSGTITANAGTGTLAVSAASLPLPSGAATSALQSASNTSVSNLDTKTPTLGQTTMTGSSPVVIASNQSAVPVSGTFWQATQPISGTVTANAGSGTMAVSGPLTDTQLRASAVPVSGTVTANAGSGTLAVSAASLPLPSGAATAAKQPALGTAGTASADVISVQGIASMTALKVDGSGVTQPISAATLPLPSGAATSALQTTGNTSVGSIDTKTPALGQAVMASSSPVVIASNQSAVPVSGTFFQATQPVSGTVTANDSYNAANNAAAPTNVNVMGAQLQSGTTAVVGTAGQVGSVTAGLDHVLYARAGGPVQWSCFVQAVTVTTQCQAAPAAGLKLYVTGVACSNLAATVQGVDVVYGTGANCVTGTTALTHKFQMGTLATTTSPFIAQWAMQTPLTPAAANAICIRPTAATSFGCTITGYTAP